MNKIIFLCLVFLAFYSGVNAQDEVIRDLEINPVIADEYEKRNYQPNPKIAATTSGYIILPFVDDFSKHSPYPDENNWNDKKVFINRTFAEAPVTIGVATFDGIDSTGYPYNFASSASSSAIADYLTSKPIRLDSFGSQKLTPADSVYFSFYYQAQGRGDAPEAKDSLVLEFRTPTKNWSYVWNKTGYAPSTNDSNFHRVMVAVKNSIWFEKGFQFRFKNYATLSGNVDHWNVDYVYLNKGRTKNDTIRQDVAFAYNPPSAIKNYTAIPYSQYSADYKDSLKVLVRNNYNSMLSVGYRYEFNEMNGTNIFSSPTSSVNVYPYVGSGFNTSLAKAKPKTEYGLIVNVPGDTVSYIAKYFLNEPGDVNRNNDTVMLQQKFYNYFSYDDGTAEGGYGLSSIYSKFAYKFSLIRPDTFRGAYMYFSPILNDVSQSSPFRLLIWNDAGGNPGAIIYKDSVRLPIYDKGEYNKFHEYKFTNGYLAVTPGTYYIGWIQNTANIMNIGFDKNINTQTKAYFNTTGTWFTSNIKGSVMLRPILGRDDLLASVSQNRNVVSSINIYPNPASDVLFIDGIEETNQQLNVSVLNAFGSEVMNVNDFSAKHIDVSNLSNGVYFLRISTNSGFNVKRFIVAR